MAEQVFIKVTTRILHHFIFQGRIWVVAEIGGQPHLWNEDDVKEPELRD